MKFISFFKIQIFLFPIYTPNLSGSVVVVLPSHEVHKLIIPWLKKFGRRLDKIPQRFVWGPVLFCIFINSLKDGIECMFGTLAHDNQFHVAEDAL